jgi:thiamine biosynthesis lipoprotein
MAAEARFRAMGSQAHVVVNGDPSLVALATARVDDLERRWSRFRVDSEISRLNAHRGEPVQVSTETFALVGRAIGAWRETRGRFDPTVLGDLIRLGYDRPFEAVAVDARNGVTTLGRDAAGVELDPVARTVTLPVGAAFDPGGLGKGLAADLVVDELLAAGAFGALVNLGGDLRAEGEPEDGAAWVVDVERASSTDVVCRLGLRGGGVATSSTARRAWNVAGERRHHLVDPATGGSVETTAVSITVLSRDATSAEIATKYALLADAGLELAALGEIGCEGLVQRADGGVEATPGLVRFTEASS